MTKKKRNIKHITFAILAVLAILCLLIYSIIGGSKRREITGTWVTDTSEVESGFQCGTQGIAASINNSTKQYNKWEMKSGKLILTGKEFRDRKVFDFSDTMAIIRLNSDQLTLEKDGKRCNYKKIR